jgi:hypothetical protein
MASENARSFGWVYRTLALAFSTMSLVMLIKHGVGEGFVPVLQALLDFYERMMTALLGWAEPMLNAALGILGQRWGWAFHLNPSWKHVFVLLMVLFGAEARNWRASGAPGWSWVSLAWGFFLAFSSALASALEPSSPYDAYHPAALACALIGIGLYYIGFELMTPLTPYWRGGRVSLSSMRFGLTLIVIAACLFALGYLPRFAMLSPIGEISLLGILVLVLASLFVMRGFQLRGYYMEFEGMSSYRAFLKHPSTQLGLSIFQVYGAVAAFILTNAGLKFAGL